eukprot:12409071-Karenia_brevis.AAC.1
MEDHEQYAQIWEQLTSKRNKDEDLFPFQFKDWEQEFKDTIQKLGLGQRGYVRYSTRHAAASADILLHRRTEEA